MENAKKAGNKLGLGLAIGGVVAGVIGYGWGYLDGSGAPGVGARVVEQPSASAALSVSVGRGHRSGSYTMFPVKLSNAGEALSYAKVTCALYNEQGEFVASEYTNWTEVPARSEVTGEVGSRVSDVARAECRPSSS